MAKVKLQSTSENDDKYIVTRDGYGFGFIVLKKSVRDENDKIVTPSERVFYSSSEKQCRAACKDFVAKGETKLVPEINWNPLLLIIRGKHGNQFFLVKNLVELQEISLALVKERYAASHYQYLFDNEDIELVTEEDIANIKNRNLKLAAIRERKEGLRYQKFLQENSKCLELLLKADKDNDGNSAYKFLQLMKEGEYENFELIKFSNKHYNIR